VPKNIEDPIQHLCDSVGIRLDCKRQL